jgi:ATP-dependent protease Clp ATPase subunit
MPMLKIKSGSRIPTIEDLAVGQMGFCSSNKSIYYRHEDELINFGNIETIIQELIQNNEFITTVQNLGINEDLSKLLTDDKDSLVGSINEVFNFLNTFHQAINEING